MVAGRPPEILGRAEVEILEERPANAAARTEAEEQKMAMENLIPDDDQQPVASANNQVRSLCSQAASARTVFLLKVTFLFAFSAIFAQATDLYKDKTQAYQDTMPSVHFESYIMTLMLSFFLYENDAAVTRKGDTIEDSREVQVSGDRCSLSPYVRSIIDWVPAVLVTFGWTLVQELGGTGISLSFTSIREKWKPWTFVAFGLSGVLIICVLVKRIQEVRNRINPYALFASKGFWIKTVLVLTYFVLGFVFLHGFHLHHWFIGFVLALSMADAQTVICQVFRSFCFGLFLHGVSAWSPSGFFAGAN